MEKYRPFNLFFAVMFSALFVSAVSAWEPVRTFVLDCLLGVQYALLWTGTATLQVFNFSLAKTY